MNIQQIQTTLRRAISQYGIESEDYDTEILVSFISVDLYKNLNDIRIAPAPPPAKSSRQGVASPSKGNRTRRQTPTPQVSGTESEGDTLVKTSPES